MNPGTSPSQRRAARLAKQALPTGLAVSVVLWAGLGLAAGPPALRPPAPEAVVEARALVQGMKTSPKGPYHRIAWFCNDGTTQPPVPFACREHGGGRQHAEYSEQRERLAALGWPVGTIIAATPWEEIWDEGRRHQRLRALSVERYLVDTEEGWVLRRARYYRGRVQIEDEEETGRAHLLQILSRPDWVAANYLLARESVRTLPHHGGTDRTRTIRRLAQSVSDADSTFRDLRVEIHSTPDSSDIVRVRAWAARASGRQAEPSVLEAVEELATEMESLYGGERRVERLKELAHALSRSPRSRGIGERMQQVLAAPPARRIPETAAVLREIRDHICASEAAESNLALMDLSMELEAEVVSDAHTWLARPEPRSRRELLELSRAMADAAYGTGFLSVRERRSLTDTLDSLVVSPRVKTATYVATTQTLRRAGRWALATVHYTFGEAIVSFQALEPAAATFPDDLVRGSAMLPLAEAARRVALDAEARAGISHRLLGRDRSGMLGLNPGLAVGPLRVVDDSEDGGAPALAREDIVVLPRTPSSLDPVAGILTMSAGNLLSHVQILARNLGIPNATLAPSLLPELKAVEGKEVLLAVSANGSVVLERGDALSGEVSALVRRQTPDTTRVDAPSPDRGRRNLLTLKELRADLAGKVVGPKAANLGELAHRFPGHVAPAVALPFAIFAEHISRGSDSPKARLDGAFRRHRAGEIDDAALALEVEEVRKAVAGLALSPELQAALRSTMQDLFGDPGTYGVFVRSDTNVEDLPGFSGAGLNLTVPNVVKPADVLAAITRVWASPFEARAMKWREQLLEHPEEVYTSVLLMKSVPVEKSGVLVTTDLVTRGEGITVATAWGVGGAVDNETAETLVIRGDGSYDLVGEAKAPYRRRLRAEGSVEWAPAAAGSVLTANEREVLRELAAKVMREYPREIGPTGEPLPWDVEFGFLDGGLQLFQIRPLVERGAFLAERVVSASAREKPGADRRNPAALVVDLDAPVDVGAAE